MSSMGYMSSTVISITNQTGGRAVITLSHRHHQEAPRISMPVTVGPGGTVHNILTARFNGGFLCAGMDFWWIGVEVLDGPNAGSYVSEGAAENPVLECMLKCDDKVAALPFTLSSEAFVMNLLSGSCVAPLRKVGDILPMTAYRDNAALAV